MRNLTRRGGTARTRTPTRTRTPKGLSFEVSDLFLCKAWADYHGFRMAVRLDHCAKGEEYEEVIAIHTGNGQVCRLLMWCNTQGIFVQPLIGKRQRYASFAEALESVLPLGPSQTSNITVAGWPY